MIHETCLDIFQIWKLSPAFSCLPEHLWCVLYNHRDTFVAGEGFHTEETHIRETSETANVEWARQLKFGFMTTPHLLNHWKSQLLVVTDLGSWLHCHIMCLLCGIKHFFHVNAYAMFSLEFRLSLMSQMKQTIFKDWEMYYFFGSWSVCAKIN